MGIGASVSKTTLFRFLSVSGEFGFAPVGTTSLTLEGVEYTLEPTVSGGLAMVSLHPFRSNFSLGAGYLLGGYSGRAMSPENARAYVLGSQTYLVEQYGPLEGLFELKGPVPAFMMGWRGAGFNFGLGVALTEPTVELTASGPMASDPGFQAALAQERSDLANALQVELFGIDRKSVV